MMGDRLRLDGQDQEQDQELKMINSFETMQPSFSSNHGTNPMISDGGEGAYEMGELDQALFLFLNHGNVENNYSTAAQEHKQTLNIFPSQPMHLHADTPTKGGLSLAASTSGSSKFSAEQSMELGKNPRTDHDMTSAKGKDIIKTSPKKELESKGSTSSNSEQKRPRTADAKTLRRLAQNREAAKKSRIRKKAYILQLENSRIKLIQLEQELHRAKTQGLFINSSSSSVNGPSSDAASFGMEVERWKEKQHRLACELKAAIQQEQLPETELKIYVERLLAHYDVMMKLKNVMINCDVFHIVSGMWVSPAERCFLWIGGFRPSQLIKIAFRHIEIEPLTEQQIAGICGLQQSVKEAEETMSQGIETFYQSLSDSIISDATLSNCPSNNMTNYMSKLSTLQGLVTQADNLRYQMIHMLHQMLTTRQAALCFLAIEDYFHRLRALSSLWLDRPRTI